MLSAILKNSRILAAQVVHLELKALSPFDYLPGQFIRLSVGEESPGVPARRCYSLASAPKSNGEFDLCLKQVAGGHSSVFLQKLTQGDLLEFEPPDGDFILRSPLRNSLFIASGTGVAPVRAMVQSLFTGRNRSIGRDFSLFHCAQSVEGLYYHDEFEEIARLNRNFYYRPILVGKQPGESTPIIAAVSEAVLSRCGVDIYTCGAPGLLQSCEDLVLKYATNDHRLLKAA
jgi:ferredoxin-NADP reductase